MREEPKLIDIKFSKWVEHFVILRNGKTIKLEEHQKKILDHVFNFDSEDKLPYRLLVYSACKKHGKTTIGSVNL